MCSVGLRTTGFISVTGIPGVLIDRCPSEEHTVSVPQQNQEHCETVKNKWYEKLLKENRDWSYKLQVSVV